MSLFIAVFFSFLAATSLVIMGFVLVKSAQTSPQARIRKRLTLIGNKPYASRTEVQTLLKGTIHSEIPWLHQFLTGLNLTRGISVLLERANLDITLSLFLLFSLLFGSIATLLLTLFDQSFYLVCVTGLLAASCPYLYARYLAAKRLRRFLEQMPDGLDMIAQGLQAGLGLTQAMVYVSKEMPDPMGTETTVFMEEMNLGLPLGDALRGLEERVPLPELRLLSTAMLVQREIGGSLAELLTKLADVIRDRFRIERQIKTLTAQNRLSAWVVSALPPLLAIFMFFMDPALMNETWSNSVGRMMFMAAIGMEICGILMFRKIIQIHI